MKLRRTVLFIPGTLPEAQVRDTIATCNADLICLDLEDTVVPARKQEARELIVRLLNEDVWGRSARAVRINAMTSAYADDDVRVVVGGAGNRVGTLLMSKPETVEDIHRLDTLIDPLRTEHGISEPIGYLVGIESARALTDIDRLASCSPNVEGLGFAVGDLSASLGVQISAYLQDRSLYPGDLFHFHRARIILAARTHGLWALDMPWPIINDLNTLSEDARWGMMMGFDGKLVLMPSQVRTVHEVYRPTDAQVAYARRQLDLMEQLTARGDGSGMVDGQFLDPVVIAPCRATIARSEAPV